MILESIDSGIKRSIQARGQLLATDALVVALHSGGVLALALGRGLLIELARTQFGEQTGLFDGALEAAQSGFKRFVFLQSNDRHKVIGLLVG